MFSGPSKRLETFWCFQKNQPKNQYAFLRDQDSSFVNLVKIFKSGSFFFKKFFAFFKVCI